MEYPHYVALVPGETTTWP